MVGGSDRQRPPITEPFAERHAPIAGDSPIAEHQSPAITNR
jgi:hypothetical protein